MASLHGLMAIPLRAKTILLALVLLAGALGAAQAATVTTFNSIDVPKSVPNLQTASPTQPLGGPANSIVTVNGITAPISKITVSMYIQHGWTSDLRITLKAPGGTPALVLANNVGGQNYTLSSQRGYGDGLAIPTGPPTTPPGIGRVVFDDAGTVVISAIQSGFGPGATPGAPQVPEYYIPTGIYRPQVGSVLAVFNDLTAAQVNGNWTLMLEDSVPGDGDGNLVAWSLVVTDPGIHTWTGGGGNGAWSNPLNWQASNPPTLAENRAVIILPPGAQGMGIGTNDIGDIKVGSLTINEGYTVAGPQKMTMIAGGTISVTGTSNGTATIGMDLDLGGATTIDAAAGTTLALNGIVDDNLTATGSLVFNGPGTLLLAGNNAYNGATTVNAGVVQISNANSLGNTVGTTTVVAGATVVLTAAVATNEPLVLAGTGSAGQGALATTVSATWAGAITLAPGVTGFGSSPAGVVLTIGNLAAVPAGSYGFSKVGAGDITLNAALPASSVLGANGGGTLTLGAAQPNLAGITLTGGTTIASGANLMTLAGGISCSASPVASTITGQLAVGATARALDVAAGSTLSFPTTLAITGAGGLVQTGGGTLDWRTTSAGVPLVMTGGTLTGNAGSMGALTVTSGIIDRSGPLATGALNLGGGALLRFNGAGDLIRATGGVTLGGGLLQPLAASGDVIENVTAGAVNGQFYGMTAGNGVIYNGSIAPSNGANDVQLSGLGATTVSFAPTAYSVDENGGTVTVTLTASATSGNVILGSFGGSAIAGADFVLPTALVDFAIGGATQNIVIRINNDNISEGDEIANLVIIPLSGCHLASVATASAAVTILDDDDNDGGKCGFGTGLTVFFLFGFGLLMRLGLRRRR